MRWDIIGRVDKVLLLVASHASHEAPLFSQYSALLADIEALSPKPLFGGGISEVVSQAGACILQSNDAIMVQMIALARITNSRQGSAG